MGIMSDAPADFGKRIAAARAYSGIDLDSLADSLSLSPHALHRIEAGLEDLDETQRWGLIKAIAAATRLPEQFLTVDFDSLATDEPPERKLDQLEAKIDAALARMDEVVAEAEGQMTRGKKQLDRFIEHQQPERDLLRRIAEHLNIPLD
jgi:transcriptional regulator with XRE-family HTH domain